MAKGKKKNKKTVKGRNFFVAQNLEFDMIASRTQMESFARKIAKSQKRAVIIIERKRNGRQR